jgi:glycosyltransferase involved in cell wall biosynthesis
LRRSAIARTTLRRVDRVVVPSRFLVDVMRGFDIGATIVPNVIDLDRFAFRERETLRPRIVSTRNFEPLYNVAITLRTFRLVQDRWPDAILTLVGGGTEEPRLRALASELQLRNVTFAGRVQPDQMGGYYAGSDIYLQSPDIDNMPASVLEAYAAGLPVVSTDAGGVPAILTHGEHGLLARTGDHRTLASHLLRLLDRPDYARQLARTAHAFCRTFAWANLRNRWLEVYYDVLSRQESMAARPTLQAETAGPGNRNQS